MRHFRPGLPVVVLTPPPWRSAQYPSTATHAAAVSACRRWAAAHDVAVADDVDVVARMHAAGAGNPDGLHWDWPTHAAVGRLVAGAVRLPAPPLR